jgi:hypothetical protein
VQVLGLTNYSMDVHASQLRHCIKHDGLTAELALSFAKDRLRNMWFVGTYETLRQSLAAVASTMKIDLSNLAFRSNSPHAFSYDGGEADEKACHPSLSLPSMTLLSMCAHTTLPPPFCVLSGGCPGSASEYSRMLKRAAVMYSVSTNALP